jgi:two-component system sensor histidine kinase MprB
MALVCASAVALVVALGSVVAYGLVRDSLHHEVDSSLKEAASAPFARPDVSFELPVEKQFVPAEGPVLLPMRNGVVLPRTDQVIGVARGAGTAFFEDRTIDGVRARVYVTPAPGGLGAIQVARSLREVDDVLGRLRLGLGALAAIGILLAALLGRLAARAAVQPVAELTSAVEHVTVTQDLSKRIVPGGRDELGRLAGAFNTMLAKLDDSQRAQRRLVADASHELRTPLTSLRTNLEVLDSELEPADRERLRADLVTQLEEMTGLVGDLVDLAREDEPMGAEAEDVRLDLLAASAVERARRHAPEVRFHLLAEPTIVRAVPARLDRAVANLLDNAAKFGGGEGPVEVVVRDGEIAVRDHGPGIAEADRPRVFDRFYRAAAARGRPGSGLGLAIVRQVAESHGGRVSAEPAPGGGALLRLSLTS